MKKKTTCFPKHIQADALKCLKRAHILVPFLQLIQYSVTVALGSVTWHCDKQPSNIRK